jgi:hypothetical protein
MDKTKSFFSNEIQLKKNSCQILGKTQSLFFSIEKKMITFEELKDVLW